MRWHDTPPAPLSPSALHVWRVRLDAGSEDDAIPLLSPVEREQRQSLALPDLRRRYAIAHGMLRDILSRYVLHPPASLAFATGEFGKPRLATPAASDIHFNLAHSGDVALVAVARGRAVGVDVERWTDRFRPAELAPRVFSLAECRALNELSPASQVVEAFFAAWTRKEAYMKATGHGITRGFAHFDVTLEPGRPARLLADRLDEAASAHWVMHALDVGPGFSAAVVAEAPVDEVLLMDAAAAGALSGWP